MAASAHATRRFTPTPIPGLVSRIGALAPKEPIVDAHVAARTFPGAARRVSAHPGSKPVTHAWIDAVLPVTHLLAGMRSVNRREDAVDARHDECLGTLKGSKETRLAGRERRLHWDQGRIQRQ